MATRLNARLGLSVGTTPTNVIDANGSITANSVTVANTFAVGANVNANTTGLYVGNSTVNSTVTSSLLQVANSTSTTNVSANGVYVGGTYINSTAIVSANAVYSAAGADGQVVITDSTNGSIEIGKQGRTNAGTPYIDFHSVAGSLDYDVRLIASGGSSSFSGSGNLQIAASNLNLPNTVITGTANATVGFNVGANVTVNTSTIAVGNATTNVWLTSNTLSFSSDPGTGIAFYQSFANYFIAMRPYTATQAGRMDTTSDYNMYFQMNGGTNRGFVFRTGANPVAQIDASGNIFANGIVYVGNSTVNTVVAPASISTTGFINVATTANIGGAITARSTVTVNGALTVANTAALGNTTITGFANVVGNIQAQYIRTTGGVQIDGDLTVNGNTITIGVTNLSVSDNMIYLNEAEAVTITSATSNGTAFIYTANNGYAVGEVVTITGISPTGYNVTANTIVVANATHFTVANATSPGAYVSGGTATAKIAANPDLGFVGAYDDGTYRHAGMFRDATDGVFKLFDQYVPEPSGAFIDTSNNTFRIADFQANNTTLSGNTYLGGTVGNETVRIATGTNTGKYTLLSSDTGNNFQLIGGVGGTNLGLYASGGGLIRFFTNGALGEEQFRISRTTSAVNYLSVTGSVTGGGVVLSSAGSDANVSINYLAKGTGQHNFNTTNGTQFQVYDNGGTAANFWSVRGATASNPPVLYAQGSDTNVDGIITSKGTGALRFYTNGFNDYQFRIGHTASAVNYIVATGGATGVWPSFTAGGADANIGVQYYAKGSGAHSFNTGTNSTQLYVSHTASAVNYLQITGAATGNRIALSAQGADTDIGINYLAKGAGYHVFAGQSGTIQMAIQPTASAVNYAQFAGAATGGAPSVYWTGGDTNVNGAYTTKGTGSHIFYTNGNAQFRINDVASAVNYWAATGGAAGSGVYLAANGTDTNISIDVRTKGTGSFEVSTGGTYAPQFRVAHTASAVNFLQITGAATTNRPSFTAQGSDANIGINYTAKGTGDHKFSSAAGTEFLIYTFGGTTANYWSAVGASTTTAPFLFAQGSDTNVDGKLTTKGSGSLRMYTNGGSDEQFRIVHTANAINFIQTAGANTTNAPYLLATGSDTNVPFVIGTKGAGALIFKTAGLGPTQFQIAHTGTAVNYLQATGGATGTGPTLTAQGTDTNVDIIYTTKGTGGHVFGTGNGTAAKIVDNGVATDRYVELRGGAVSTGGSYVTSSSGSLYLGATVGSVRVFTGGVGQTEQFRVAHTTSAVNYVQVTGSATGGAVYVTAQGTDANVDFTVASKGTSNVNIQTGSGTGFRVADSGGSDYWTVKAGTGTPGLYLSGSSTNINGAITTKGTGYITLGTNSFNQEAVRITHTASAVNYLQLTGGATGTAVSISAQGSDANVALNIAAKASANININSNTNFAANTLTFTGSAGSNTNIALRVLNDGTLSFEGGAGQLFSISNNMTGQIFAVNDISGIPSIEVFSNGQVNMARYGGNVSIGAATSAVTLNGAVTFANAVTAANTLTLSSGGAALTLSNTSTAYINFGAGGYAAPTATSRSTGTKLVLFSALTSTSTDYALGVEGNHLWFGAPSSATDGFKWYSNTTNIMTSNTAGLAINSGQLSVGANAIVNTSAVFVGNSTVNTVITQTTAAFNANSTLTALYVAANGNIGISNNTPASKVVIDDSAGLGTGMVINGGGSGGPLLTLNRTVGATGSLQLGVAGSDPQISFRTSSTVQANQAALGVDMVTGNFRIAGSGVIDTNDLFTLSLANGNVGIGNSTPAYKLRVEGTASIATDLTVGGNLTVSGTTTYINTTALNVGDNIITLNADLGAVAPSENAGFEVNRGTSTNTSFYWDETNDRWVASVGDSNISEFVLLSNAYSRSIYTNTGSGFFERWGTVASPSSLGEFSISGGVTKFDTKNRDYFIANGSVNTAVFAANGNVGIGVTAPTSKLAIEGNTVSISSENAATKLTIQNRGNNTVMNWPQLQIIHYSGNTAAGDSGGFPVAELIRYRGNTSAPLAVASGDILGGFNTWGSNGSTNQSATRIQGIAEANFTTNATSALTFHTTNAGTQAEVVRMSANGNVGIGNTAPTKKLVVEGNTRIVGDLRIGPEGEDAATRTISSGGDLFIRANDTGTDGSYSVLSLESGPTSGAGAITLKTNTVQRMLVAANGNIGIGNATPTDKLRVEGTLSHLGLTPSTGTGIDQIYTATPSLTLNTTWQSTGVTATNLANGTYIVQMLANDVAAGGTANNEYYSGIMSWYSADVNSTVIDEIPLHRAGVSGSNNSIFLATQRTPTANTSDLILMISSAANNSSASTYTLKFRRMI